jgi:hypothetical protein
MDFKKIIAATTITGSLGAGVLGLGAGTVQADPGWGPDIPWIPEPGHWFPDGDLWPGPGDISHLCLWHSPPGHWIGGPHGIPCT